MRAIAAIAFACLLLGGCGERQPTVITGQAMGTGYHIKLVGDHPPADELERDVAALFDAIEDEASPWRSESWVSRFNRSDSLEPVAVPGHVWAMLVVAQEVHAESGGLLDVTVGPLVELWGFGHAPSGTSPSDEQVAELLARCGFNKLVMDHDAQTVAKTAAGVQIDLSALAKGYAIDRIAALLDERGATDFVIDFGGEVYARGDGPGGDGWVVAIGQRASGERVTLHDQAAATSGGSEQNKTLADGTVVTHLIDPRTGIPMSEVSRLVTVVASEGVRADAWATAISVAQRSEVAGLRGRGGLDEVLIR